MGKHLTYPEHKHTSVEWFPTVPGSWDVLYARRIFKQVREAAKPDDEQLAATQKYGVIPQRLFMEYQDQKVVLALSGTDNFKHVEIDDFVISLRSFQGGIERCHYKGCVSPAYTVMRRTKPIEPSYFSYLQKSEGFITALQAVTQGIREGKTITFDQFGGIPLPFPSHVEQQQIANFLDHETAKIDWLIAKQKRLIELLKEKRQAVISHAVTKGLNPDAPMKDSGVEWLGMVPVHWIVWKISHAYVRLGSGTTPQSDGEEWYGGDIPWVTTGELRESVVTETAKCVNETALIKYSALKVFPAGSLVMAMYGATIGRVGILGVPATTNQACCVLPCSRSLNNLYVYYFLQAFRDEIVQLGTGGGQPNISQQKVASIKVPAPSLEEQERIIEHIASQTAKYDELMEKAAKAIALMKEHRTALISAAVTGKIDVRGWQKPNTEPQEAATAASA